MPDVRHITTPDNPRTMPSRGRVDSEVKLRTGRIQEKTIKFRAGEGSRTPNLLITNQLLCH